MSLWFPVVEGVRSFNWEHRTVLISLRSPSRLFHAVKQQWSCFLISTPINEYKKNESNVSILSSLHRLRACFSELLKVEQDHEYDLFQTVG
jgi:hypothetical protein